MPEAVNCKYARQSWHFALRRPSAWYSRITGPCDASVAHLCHPRGGAVNNVGVALLPEQHRAVVGCGGLGKIEDPLSRLVAAIELAADTASNQGWRRPLLAWLGVQEQRAKAAGDTGAADQIRRRMALASGTLPAGQ